MLNVEVMPNSFINQEPIRDGEAVAGFDIRKGVFDLINPTIQILVKKILFH